MAKYILILFCLCLFPISSGAQETDDEIELKMTTIQGNKELPKILYIVPWKEVKNPPKPQRQLVLHSLFGDLFEPVLPPPWSY